jgi:hypothetical protein
LTLGIVLYILGDFAFLISHDHLANAALVLAQNTLQADVLAMLTVCVLPIALSASSATLGNKARNRFVFCALMGAFVIDSGLFYILLAVSVLVYITFAHKAPCGALLFGAIIVPPLLVITSDYTLSTAVSVGRTVFDGSLELEASNAFANFWSGFYDISNGATVVLFISALILILQRAFRAASISHGGTVSASAVMTVVCMSLFNPFSDLRSLVAMWFILGLCGAVYGVCSKESNEYTEV